MEGINQLNGHELEQAPGVGDGQGNLACSERQGVISDSGGGRPFWGAVEGDWAQERSVQKVPSATARVRRAGHVAYITPLDALSFSEKAKLKVLVAQLCPTLCDPMSCSPPGSSLH